MSEQPKPSEGSTAPPTAMNAVSTHGVISDEELDKLFDVPFTFSRFCITGLVPTYAQRCECWRCREQRGEPRDEELAESVAREARKGWDRWMAEFVRKMLAGEV